MPGSLASALASAWEVSDLVSMHFEAKKRTKTGVFGQKRDLKWVLKWLKKTQNLNSIDWNCFKVMGDRPEGSFIPILRVRNMSNGPEVQKLDMEI